MDGNKVSVVIPTYNERDNISIILRNIDEALDGKWHYQIIVVDDSSPDGTGDAVRGLAEKDDRISLIERPGKLGLGSAVLVKAFMACELFLPDILLIAMPEIPDPVDKA